MKTDFFKSVLLFASAAFALPAFGSLKFAFVAPDALTPQNAAVFNGMRDAFAELQSRYGKTFEVEYIDARLSAENQAKQLGGAYIGGFAGAVVLPVECAKPLSEKISALADRGFPVALVGSDMPESKRLCFVGDDRDSFGKILSGLIAELSRGKKFSLFCYFRGAPSADITPTDTAEISALLGGAMPLDAYKEAVSKYNPKLVSADYYSVYARQNSVEIMRRDDYGELFFSPYLLADMQPIKRDSDRLFAVCVGAVPQLERYLADSSVNACVFGDYYGWGYFAARALAEKAVGKSNPEKEVRLLKPLVATPKNLNSFIADWRRWLR